MQEAEAQQAHEDLKEEAQQKLACAQKVRVAEVQQLSHDLLMIRVDHACQIEQLKLEAKRATATADCTSVELTEGFTVRTPKLQ